MDKHTEQVLKTFNELQENVASTQAAATLVLAAQVARLNETWEGFDEAMGEYFHSSSDAVAKQLQEIDKTLIKGLR